MAVALKAPPAEAAGGTLWPWLMVTARNTLKRLFAHARASKRIPTGGMLRLNDADERVIKSVFPCVDSVDPQQVAEENDAVAAMRALPQQQAFVLALMIEHPDDPIAVLAARARLQLRTFERRLQEARKQFALVMGLDFPTGSKKTPGSRSG